MSGLPSESSRSGRILEKITTRICLDVLVDIADYRQPQFLFVGSQSVFCPSETRFGLRTM